ncbi:MAG: lysylphosphatidylglycerol synthase transmembrane domain-containing protein [Planctomycetota bacterium]|nr:lysylphosphatidylglycerol synthase transmembrane domain-containing protein [Planctomycetota bacterium]
MKKTVLRILLSVAVSLAVLTALMYYTDTNPKELFATLGELSPWVYLGALGFHLSTYTLRALRFWMLIPRAIRPSFRRIWVISGAHNLASYVLPAKTGEASWVVYLRAFTGVPSAPGIASLVVSRLLDAAVLACALSLACWYLATHGGHGNLEEIAKYGSPLALIGVSLAAITIRGDLLVHLLSKSLRFARLHRWELGERLVEKITQIAHAMREAGRGHRLGLAALLTVPVWFCIFGFYAMLARGMNIDADLDVALSFPEAIFGSSLAVLANLLPINGAAGVGTQEMGWVFGFVLIGIQESRALTVGLAVHFVQLFNVVAIGLFSHLAMKSMARAERIDFEGLLASGALNVDKHEGEPMDPDSLLDSNTDPAESARSEAPDEPDSAQNQPSPTAKP